MKNKAILLLAYLLTIVVRTNAQEVPILDYSVDANGQARLSVASTEDHYYVLHVRHDASGEFEQATALALGKNGSTNLTEPLAAYPKTHYKVTEHLKSAPADTDGDGVDDLTEWADMPAKSPFNAAPPIDFENGVVSVPDRLLFKKLSRPPASGGQTLPSDNIEVKFYIRYRDDKEPKLYFVNSNTHVLHTDFALAIGYHNDGTLMTGSIVFHPDVAAPNGTLGVYRFVFQPNNTFTHVYVQKAMELLAANMPFLKNNLCYYPLEQVQVPLYFQEKDKYDASRICVLLEDDLFADVNYLAMHVAEGYGILRAMTLNETPGPRDVVLYEALPNELPRVGGIITSVMQTPLSHVNLRAIQDNVPNAFIRNALQLPGVDSLLGQYVYYKVEQQGYTLRAATQQEVNQHYESIRPKQGQTPVRDLTKTKIKPLDSIAFAESASFGVKCANVATMRRFGFPDGTIPDGFGIPFYFYDEFMKFNGFYDKARSMLADDDFLSNFNARIQILTDFRKEIKNASMPQWMLDELDDMQQSFLPGTSIRCRSSTNNEDLPGFSGAGLYDSYTQHPNEGHIAKSIKQVYASMWNFRAFEERDFYRIDHFAAAMGVLVHPNFEHEQANGVGVSTDPIYQTEHTFYLNTQVGEDLVTNPNALSVPEEILLDAEGTSGDDFALISPSNQVPMDSLIMKAPYLNQMRDFLGTIHDKFQVLYGALGKAGFAMEIEYKINAEGQLNIKQARPWAAFWADAGPPEDSTRVKHNLTAYPNPFYDILNLTCDCEAEVDIEIVNLLGQKTGEVRVDFRRSQRRISLGYLAAGVYFLRGKDGAGKQYFSGKLLKL